MLVYMYPVQETSQDSAVAAVKYMYPRLVTKWQPQLHRYVRESSIIMKPFENDYRGIFGKKVGFVGLDTIFKPNLMVYFGYFLLVFFFIVVSFFMIFGHMVWSWWYYGKKDKLGNNKNKNV